MRVLKCHSEKNVKGGSFGILFLTSFLLQTIKTFEGGPFDAIKKFSKKSLSADNLN